MYICRDVGFRITFSARRSFLQFSIFWEYCICFFFSQLNLAFHCDIRFGIVAENKSTKLTIIIPSKNSVII